MRGLSHSPSQGPISSVWRNREGGWIFFPPFEDERLSRPVGYWGFPGFTEFGNMCPEDHLHISTHYESQRANTALYVFMWVRKDEGPCPPLQDSVLGCCSLLLYTDQFPLFVLP